MKKYIGLVLLGTALLSSGCGDGGGDDTRNVSGTWIGALTKVSDGCPAASPATITVSHQVSQNEDAISLIAESGVQFLGNAVGNDGFSVDGSHTTIGNTNCRDQSEISYDDINDDDDTSATIDLTIMRSCTGQSTCQIDFTGTVSRLQ